MFQSFPVLQFPQRFADQVEGGDDVGGEGATVNLRPVTGGRRAEGLSFGRELRGHRAPGHGRLSRSQAPLCVAFQILRLYFVETYREPQIGNVSNRANLCLEKNILAWTKIILSKHLYESNPRLISSYI